MKQLEEIKADRPCRHRPKGENSTLHNAVLHREDEACGENTVVEVLQRYAIEGKVICHAMVKSPTEIFIYFSF